MLQSSMHVQTGRDGVLNRRSFLGGVGAGVAGLGAFGWQQAIAQQAAELRRRDMSCIVLFMLGGPSQFESFDPKPGVPTGGPTRAIPTALPGYHMGADWPNVARSMQDISVIRSCVGREPDHPRATYHMHTGYQPLGAVQFPSFGSIVSSEIAPRDRDLPSYVSVSNRQQAHGPGFLGMAHAPFIVSSNAIPSNVSLPSGVASSRFEQRIDLLRDLEQEFAENGGRARVQEHQAMTAAAAQMIRSPRLRAFDLNQEPMRVRDRYGRSSFGQGCLLARRLVDEGVTFVEVTSQGWDTHEDNFNRSTALANSVDPAFAALVEDLKVRGRLDKTLVIWMGEFGRSPQIDNKAGRNHYPRAFSVALAGGGVQGGRIIGSTSAGGQDVASRPVPVVDLFCTFCHALGIDHRKENMTSVGRPIRIVDGGQPVQELFA
jgi:Protein of unknown function (DUF1501)